MFYFEVEKGLRLELPEPSQEKELADLVQKNLDHLQAWMPWALDDYSIEHARQWIDQTRAEFAETGAFNALIVLDGELIGTIGFHRLDKLNRHAEIGYWIDKRSEGKGIVTKCCGVLIRYLFDKMELNRIQINCNIENLRSRAIPERLHFRLEGILREVEYLNGRYGDWAIYGLLRNEWKEDNNKD